MSYAKAAASFIATLWTCFRDDCRAKRGLHRRSVCSGSKQRTPSRAPFSALGPGTTRWVWLSFINANAILPSRHPLTKFRCLPPGANRRTRLAERRDRGNNACPAKRARSSDKYYLASPVRLLFRGNPFQVEQCAPLVYSSRPCFRRNARETLCTLFAFCVTFGLVRLALMTASGRRQVCAFRRRVLTDEAFRMCLCFCWSVCSAQSTFFSSCAHMGV